MSAGSLTYNSYAATATEITLENAITTTPTDDGVTVLVKLNLDPSAQPQTDTVTIASTLPSGDSYYRITIDDYTANAAQTFTYLYKTTSADTNLTIAAKLAALINAALPNRPDVSAKTQADANANKIDIVSQFPGTGGAFTSTVECFDAATNAAASGSPITKTSVAGSGTGKMRSIVQFTAEMQSTDSSSSYSSYPELRLTGTWYNGASPAVAQSAISAKYTGPLSLDALRAVT